MEPEFYGKCTILAGISGAGKTHYSQAIEGTSVFSTDDFWVKDNDDYTFDPSRITEAQQSKRLDGLVESMPPWWKKKVIWNG